MQFANILLFSFLSFNVVNADELQAHRYNLPINKKNLATCFSHALALYSGTIEKQQLLEIQSHFFVQYDIQIPNKETRTVICDLDDGQITSNPHSTNSQQ